VETGFLAQDLQQAVSDNNADYLNLVDESDPDNLSIYKSNLIPVMVKAIQELSQENDELKARLAAIEARLDG
jgi:hypothetical protein